MDNKNEIIEIDNKAVDYSAYNDVEDAEEVIGIDVIRRDTPKKDGSGTFPTFSGYMILDIFDENGKFVKTDGKWINLKFRENAFDDVNAEYCKLRKPKDVKTGTLYVRSTGINAPFEYKVTVDEKGEKVYPTIWIREGIVGFKQFKRDYSNFKRRANAHKDALPEASETTVTVDEETGEVLEG